MESVNITVNRLGRVKNTRLEVKPLTIFSGESGLGKSYLAILCHYVFVLMVDRHRLNGFFSDKGFDYNTLSSGFKNEGVALKVDKRELEEWLAHDAVRYVGYMLNDAELDGDVAIQLPASVPDTITISFREEYTGLVGDEDVYIILSIGMLQSRVSTKTQFDESPFAFLLRYALIQFIYGDFKKLESTFVMPPSRGPILTEEVVPRTGLYREFLRCRQEWEAASPRISESASQAASLLHEVIEGEVSKGEAGYIYETGGVRMPISRAAASVKEVAPLLLRAKKFDVGREAILFEEPEAHLHPTKQRMMADVVCALVKAGSAMQVTTHSDYFLRRLNELIIIKNNKATKQDKKSYEEALYKLGIVDDITPDAEDLSAYLLIRDADDSSCAVRQDVSDGVPFSSFMEAAKTNLENADFLDSLKEQ